MGDKRRITGSMITGRQMQRGAPLLRQCHRAHTVKHECGDDDERVFCYGLEDAGSRVLNGECLDCTAHVEYAIPVKEKDDAR